MFSKKVLPLALSVICPILFFAQIRDMIDLQNILDSRYEVYRDIGEWLADNSQPGSIVATLEIGIIGYFSPNNVFVDFSGLLQPEVVHVFSSQTTYDDSALILAKTYHPDFFVLIPEMFSQLETEYVKPLCAPVRFISAGSFSFSRDLIIYQCER